MRVRPKTLSRARALRKAMTLPEVHLWQQLRRERFQGVRIRRQMPVGPYVADFGGVERKLAIEVDGASHDEESAIRHDARRAAYFEAQGIAIYRIAAKDILADMNGVLEALEAFLLRR